MDKERFERARAIRAEIAWLKAISGPDVMDVDVKPIIARYDEEIAKLEKEFNAL